jgi:16S rRNA (cytosine967-C5)-methyltransferase
VCVIPRSLGRANTNKWISNLKKSVRAHAAEIIHTLQNNQSNLDALLKKHSKCLQEPEKRYLQSLCYGVCREWFHLEAIEKGLLEKPLKARDQILSAIIRCGIYELGWMGTKEHAVVNESVDVAAAEGRPWARGLINAILRHFLRNKSELKMERLNEEALWNHPHWLIENIKVSWPKYWESILVENNVHPPMWLRVNRKKIQRDAYLERLLNANIKATKGSAPDSIRLTEPSPVNCLPGFDDGLLSVQDESSQWASIALNPLAKERVLDACAAPGGKTCHILEMANCDLTALDISEQRLARVAENCLRLGLRATLKAADISQLSRWWDKAHYDAVLVDLPCSATGVIRRHPDIRIMRSEQSLRSLAEIQSAILDASWKTVGVGGRMLVTTCSILSQENDKQIYKFTQRHSDVTIIKLSGIPGIVTNHGIQQLPNHEGGDGFYYALLVKSQFPNERVSA